MDRHVFVKSQIAERDKLVEQRNRLKENRDRAYSRSTERFRKLLDPPEDPRTCCASEMVSVSLSSIFASPAELPEDARVTDDDIQKLCGDISRLKDECEELEAEIARLERDDFVEVIEAAMAD